MQMEPTANGFQIDALDLGPLLGVPPEDVQRLMREGRIVSLCETGQGEDCGRHRITFRHGASRVRLTVNDAGEVLLRTRTTVAPRPQTQIGTRQTDEVQSDEARSDLTWTDDMGDKPAEITRHIERHHHVRHRRRLDELGRLSEMVEDLHDGDEGVPVGLHRMFVEMADVLEAHMQMAEQVVFPAIRKSETSALEPQIDTLRDDHATLKSNCVRIREICQDFRLPDGACTSWATLYVGLAAFTCDLMEHVRLENDVLFAQIEGNV